MSDNDAAANIKAWRVFGKASLKSGFKARMNHWGSNCGSVGRVFASDSGGPLLESSHWRVLKEHFFTDNCIEKTKFKKKRP